MANPFSDTIKEILKNSFSTNADEIFKESTLLQYISKKTKSANEGVKTRGNFSALYAIYVLVQDYLAQDYDKKDGYNTSYGGAEYSNLIAKIKSLPFANGLQNHSLNNRVNTEFEKIDEKHLPIIHSVQTKRYWFNENLLKITLKSKESVNIAKVIIEIIDAYIAQKQKNLSGFLKKCPDLQQLTPTAGNIVEIKQFISGLLAPNADARFFEIVSYAILKFSYANQNVFWGYDKENLVKECLTLYKTGKTNANDGGIDFVMKPLGKFFQVTETLDFNKYFLDIDKTLKYPITFVVKFEDDVTILLQKIKKEAESKYSVQSVVDTYMGCIEEIINIPMLKIHFDTAIKNNFLSQILDEIKIYAALELQA